MADERQRGYQKKYDKKTKMISVKYVKHDMDDYDRFKEYLERTGVRRHIVGGTNRTLISVILPPRLHSPVGDRRLLAGQPHAVVALFQRQDSCF